MSTKLTHKHHIVPRHMGGTDDADNLIELTVEEHAIAHKVLWERYQKSEDYYAYMALSGQISSDTARREICRERMIKNNPSRNPESLKKMIESRKNFTHSEQTKKKMSASHRGVKKTEEHAKNIGKAKSKKYEVVTPTNDVIIVECLRHFCLKNNLSEQLMYKVANGSRTHHRGYKCKKLDNS